MGDLFPQKLPLSMGDLESHLIHDSLGPSEPTTQTASIGSAVFAGLTSVTDRPTDHATRSLTIDDRIYVYSAGDAV